MLDHSEQHDLQQYEGQDRVSSGWKDWQHLETDALREDIGALSSGTAPPACPDADAAIYADSVLICLTHHEGAQVV